ncbi:MAG TPA: CHAT domain-containing tetratricopeptide repeat protein [Cyclobacteriaceae bacterium]|nr:CHAT domain-containing tetratricopeptide repeat protein [Cyclobacteriaceae bacterium]
MKAIRLIGVLIFALLLGTTAFSQKKFDKQLAKADKYYYDGNYSKALSALSKFKKSVVAKLGQSNRYMPGYYIREARTNLNAGILTGFETSLNNAITSSAALNGDATNGHASILTDVAEIYNQYGYYRLSREYLFQALDINEKVKPEDLVLKGRINLELAETLIGQGFSSEALKLLRENEKYFLERAIDKETYVEEGKIKNRRIPEEELATRFGSYARLLTLIGYAYAKQGDIDQGDPAFKKAHDWIRDKQRFLGETSLTLVRNDYLYLKMFVENNNGVVPANLKEKYLDYGNLLDDLKKKTSPATPLAHEIYLSYLEELQRTESTARYSSLKSEYDRMLAKYFSKASLMNINLKAVEFNSKLQKEKTKNLEAEALSITNSAALPRNYSTTIRTIQFLYDMSIQTKRYTNADNYINQVHEIKKELYGENSIEYHLSRIALASFYVGYTNKIEEARKIFDESYINVVSKEIAPKYKDHLTILNSLAVLYELTDNYNLASSTLDKARDIARSKYEDTDPEYGVELDNVAQLQIKLGQYDKAEENINSSIKILEGYKKDNNRIAQYIHSIETQAKLFGIKGMFDEAQDNLDRSRKLISKADVPIGNELSTAEELSTLFIQLGRYSQTDRLLNPLVIEYEKLYGAASIRLIDPLVNKGRIMLAKGDYTEAQKVANRVNQIAVKTYTENSTKTAPTQKLLSDIYYTLGDYDKAETNIKLALVSQEKQFGRNHVEVARSLSQLALIKFYKGDDKKEVEKLMLESRDIMANKLGKDNPQYAEILKNMAVLYISEKKYDIAFSSLTIAESIWKAKTGTKNNINAASIYTLTGDVYYQQKNYRKADEFYTKAKDLYEKFFSSTHPEYVKVLSKLSKVYYMEKDYKRSKKLIEESLGNYENFIKGYFPALSEREKAKYWNTIKGDFEFYNTLAFSKLDDFKDLSGKVYTYQLLTKALLLSSSIKIRERIMNSTDEDLKNQYNTWVQKKELLTLALSMSPAQLVENEIDPASLTQEVERLEKDLSQKSELFSQSFDNRRITYEDVKKALKPNEVAIEMVRFRYFDHNFTDSVIYAALYLKSDFNRPKALTLNDGHKMETRFFKYYRNAIIGMIPDNVSYDVFWGPIQKEIGQVSTVYLSADGVYNQINLEAIPTPDGKYVLDNSNIVLVSNTKDIYLRKIKSRNSADNTASMFGNPSFYLTASADDNITPLPGTEKEITQLQFLLKQKGWDTKEYVEKTATEEKIKELNSPKIFHVATHGFYKPNEQTTTRSEMESNEAQLTQNPLMRTGLLLKGAGDLLDKTDYNFNMENGILTAYEAMNLNLDKTDLVVLSACETGLGQLESGEGVYGLQRAFLVAGAKTLIMSMFKVDDDATQKLMLKFYQKWLNSANSRQSFIDAKKELRIEFPEPIYWGAFMMIGLD